VLASKLVGNFFHVADLAQRASRGRDHNFSRRRQRRETLALPDEDAQAELILELADLFADPRLRCVESHRSLRHVETVIDDRAQIFELLEIHCVYNSISDIVPHYMTNHRAACERASSHGAGAHCPSDESA